MDDLLESTNGHNSASSIEEDQPKAQPATQTESPKAKTPKSTTDRKPSVVRSFPSFTLEESLVIVNTLKDYNGGNPWTGEEIAHVLGRGAKSPDFYYLTASSRDYGLTEGSSKGKTPISISALGREYLFAESPLAEKVVLEKAMFNVEVFKGVYDYYNGSSLPDIKYLNKVLEGTFKIPPSLHQEFYRIYTANRRFIDGFAVEHGIPVVTPDVQLPASPTSISAPVGLVRVFVIMPFTEKTEVYPPGFYSEVMSQLIMPAATEAGFEVYSALKQGSDIIHSTIINELLEAELVIADLTEHNPNVLFELGFRMAQDKPVALIRAKGTAPIFDVDNLLRVWDYNPNLWRSTLEHDVPSLISHLKGTWESRSSSRTYKKILSGKTS